MSSRGCALHREAAGVNVELRQRTGKGIRISGEVCAGRIRLVFARARHSKLNERGRNGGKDQHEQGADSASAPVVAVAASPSTKNHGPTSHTGQHGDGASYSGSDGTDEDVTVIHVAEFVGQDAFEFLIIQ